ncbi:hypothetical protein AMK68_02950 [candidate division KD3-62 bacterium DG_56]|uniref:tRNA threonylcarbamoyladenosine biosynthesis protein TsaE n=1 Tax=candidate division KD3-62 bacterium DG_56 TaxID=1704032 RepID=A0A0S7XNK9_9BACT|nr:MAG: hypothetical protein AMK68_02950 [candidate division KD3-62 bacterium DG_56]
MTTSSAAETRALGAALGRAARAGDILCLEGPLGVGKTVLVQGLAEGLGVAELATSPSFTLIHEHRGRLPLYHIDLYRLDRARVSDLFLEEYLDGDGVAAIEWAERLPAALCPNCLYLRIAYGDGDQRLFAVEARGDRATEWAKALGAT